LDPAAEPGKKSDRIDHSTWPFVSRRLDRRTASLDGEDVLDSDPVCQGRDTVGKYRVTGKADGVDRYVAIVGKVGSKPTSQVILCKINGAWKIHDVVEERGSLRALIERHDACVRENIAHHQDVDVCSLIM